MKALRMISARGDDTLAIWDETTVSPERIAEIQKEFDAKMGNPDEFVRRAFESLWGYLSPDA